MTADPLDPVLDTLRRFDGLLDRELGAIQSGDAAALSAVSAEKSAAMLPLQALLVRAQRAPLPASARAADMVALLQRCQERNRSNGMLLNVQAARGRPALHSLGFQSHGYGRHGVTALSAASRRLATA